jgi:hypothetical protein
MKVLLNKRYGGFSVSEQAMELYEQQTGTEWDDDERAYLLRADPVMVRIVETLGKDANGSRANLSIVEIPDGMQYEIDEYDGFESIRIYPPANWRALAHEPLQNVVESMMKFNHWERTPRRNPISKILYPKSYIQNPISKILYPMRNK